MDRLRYHDILYDDSQLGPYPDHLLKRVPAPTNRIPGPVERRSERETVFNRSLMGDFGEELSREFKRLAERYPIVAAIQDLQLHIAAYGKRRDPVAAKKAPLPDDPRVMSRHLKALGYYLGADQVRIGPLAPSAVYSEDVMQRPIEAPYKYAIVFAARKDARTLSGSNGWDDIVSPLSHQVYQKLALQTEVVANYLRRLGIEAVPSYMRSYLTLLPQIVLDAGMGEVSRMGIILNPFLGCNCKYAAVLTNLELEVDGYVDFGLQEYCENCTICAEQCPSHAITRGSQILHNGYYTWKLNARACSDFGILNKEGSVCGRCTKVCPWNRPDMGPHDFAEWDGSLDWLHNTVDEQRYRNIANSFVDPREYTNKWWFRLEDRDGEVVVPTEKNQEKLCRDYPIQE
jgi:epoxyqueuosine reductase